MNDPVNPSQFENQSAEDVPTVGASPESTGESDTPVVFLDHDERRVIGVLIEKSLTTPQYYPLTINAIVTGSNQKSNRDPLVEFVDDEVEEILQRLRPRGLVTEVHPSGSRSEKWRQELSTTLDLNGQEMAVLGELLLRGPQTMGELRSRANRMKNIPDQGTLQTVFDGLAARAQPLVVRLTPEGVKRGVRVTHGFYPPKELEEVIAAEEAAPGAGEPRAPRAASSSAAKELEALRKRVEAIEAHLGITPPAEGE